MDYQKLGLKVGLEIHQQLATDTKLFCQCPIVKSEEFPITKKRKIRAVAGETGYIDQAVLHQFVQNKTFVYKLNPESSCLIELDEEPPKSMNPKALKIGIQIAKLLKSTLVDEIRVMRKTIVDGSAVSGFQRTALIATGGSIQTSFGKVGIQTLCLEEDSAPALEKQGDVVTYRLDRLGVPLIEIATDPDMKTPDQVHEVAKQLGMLLRSVSVIRGIGSIRQDINISIENGERIEIKGFQDLANIPKAVENEAERQVALLEIKNELKRRGFKTSDETILDVTDVFQKTKNEFLKKIIQQNGKIIAGKLEKFSGLLKKTIGERTLGKELSYHAAAYGLGITHSDEDLKKYDLTFEFEAVQKKIRATAQDAVFIIAGQKNNEKAAHAVYARANMCGVGVPNETRVADGIGSKFTRPLPGSGRMYPESDIKPIILEKKFIKLISIPKTLQEKKKELKLPQELATQIIQSARYGTYEELAKKYDPVLVASTLLSTLRELSREGYQTKNITTEDLDAVFAAVHKNRISKDIIKDVIAKRTTGEAMEKILRGYTLIGDRDLEAIVQAIVQKHTEKKLGVLIGLVLHETKGRADGKRVSELVRKYSANL